jgi:DNA-binding protein HU-beta
MRASSTDRQGLPRNFAIAVQQVRSITSSARAIGANGLFKTLFISVRITALIHQRNPRFPEGTPMAPLNAKKPTAAKATVTLKHLAAVLADEHHLTKRAGAALLDDVVGMITKHLKKGERVRIAGLGILQVRKRAARMGRNPATGEAIKIKAGRKVAFRAAKDLKMAV